MSQQSAQQLLSALVAHMNAADPSGEASAAQLRKVRLPAVLAACLECLSYAISLTGTVECRQPGGTKGHCRSQARSLNHTLREPVANQAEGLLLWQALMQLLQRLVCAAPAAVVAMNIALAPESDAALAVLRQACNGAGGVVDEIRRSAASLAGHVRARCAAHVPLSLHYRAVQCHHTRVTMGAQGSLYSG